MRILFILKFGVLTRLGQTRDFYENLKELTKTDDDLARMKLEWSVHWGRTLKADLKELNIWMKPQLL